MFTRRLVLILTLVFCVNALSGCTEEKEGSNVRQWHDVQTKICDVLESINDKESAEEAIPKLKELAVEFTQAKNDFRTYQKANPGFAQKHSQESMRIMSEWGKALSSFNANQKIPEELRRQIMGILSL